MKIEMVGRQKSTFKTFYNYIANEDGSELLAGTSNKLTFGQVRNRVFKANKDREFGPDIEENIKKIDTETVQQQVCICYVHFTYSSDLALSTDC